MSSVRLFDFGKIYLKDRQNTKKLGQTVKKKQKRFSFFSVTLLPTLSFPKGKWPTISKQVSKTKISFYKHYTGKKKGVSLLECLRSSTISQSCQLVKRFGARSIYLICLKKFYNLASQMLLSKEINTQVTKELFFSV